MLNLLQKMIGHEAATYDETTLNFNKNPAFSYESDYIKAKRAEVIARMKEEGKLLTQGYTPSSLRGASVLNEWLEKRTVKS